jgi:hypothetical protein
LTLDLTAVQLVLAAILWATPVLGAVARSPLMLQGSAATEKESRTPAQRKIDSPLLVEIYRIEGKIDTEGKIEGKIGPTAPPGKTGVKIDDKQRALVEVRADVTPDLQKALGMLGATTVSTSVEYRSTIAWVPLLKLERLAEEPAVVAITTPSDATTFRQR